MGLALMRIGREPGIRHSVDFWIGLHSVDASLEEVTACLRPFLLREKGLQ